MDHPGGIIANGIIHIYTHTHMHKKVELVFTGPDDNECVQYRVWIGLNIRSQRAVLI